MGPFAWNACPDRPEPRGHGPSCGLATSQHAPYPPFCPQARHSPTLVASVATFGAVAIVCWRRASRGHIRTGCFVGLVGSHAPSQQAFSVLPVRPTTVAHRPSSLSPLRPELKGCNSVCSGGAAMVRRTAEGSCRASERPGSRGMMGGERGDGRSSGRGEEARHAHELASHLRWAAGASIPV